MKHTPLCTAVALIGLAGCASQPPPPPGQAFVASADAQPSARERKIVDLLASGDLAPAKVEVQALIAEEPDSREAKVLQAEMEQDPKALLGTLNFDVTAKAGDTFAGLAERYMHDRALAYALARYNGANPPVQPTPGQVLQIPGSPSGFSEGAAPRRREHPVAPAKAAPQPAKRVAEPPAPEKPAAPAEKPASEKAGPKTPAPEKPAPEKPAPAPAAKPAPPAAPAPAPHDPAKAASLRSDALVLMNKGDIGQAVVVLRQAAALDPDSAPIKADLDRAVRIQHGTQAPAAKP